MFDVITFGSAVADVFLDTGIHSRGKQICYPLGTKILVKNIDFSTGGGGLNVGVALSKLKMNVGYFGAIGNDYNGKLVMDEIKKNNIKFLGKIDKKFPTGYSVVLDCVDNERTILVYKGAGIKLKYSDLKLGKIKTKWFYFSSMVGEAYKTQEKLAEYARKKGIKIAFNPSSYLTKMGARNLKGILKNTELLILNKEEGRMLVKKGNLLKGLHELGPRLVCVTNGQKKNFFYDGKYTYISKPNRIKVKEKTGAGDAFASGLLSGLINNGSIELSMQAASANAESTVQHRGAKNGILSWRQILKAIKEKPVKLRRFE